MPPVLGLHVTSNGTIVSSGLILGIGMDGVSVGETGLKLKLQYVFGTIYGYGDVKYKIIIPKEAMGNLSVSIIDVPCNPKGENKKGI